MFDRCKLSVIHEIYTDITLLAPEFYQRNPLCGCVFILTLYPPNSGKTSFFFKFFILEIKLHD